MLLSISPSMILSKWAGDSEKAISGVFDIARSFQPCIVFLVREVPSSTVSIRLPTTLAPWLQWLHGTLMVRHTPGSRCMHGP